MTAPDLGQLQGSLGFLLRLAQVQTFEMYHAGLQDEAIGPGEFSVLYVIHRNPGIRQGVLAEHLRIKRAHMTKLVRRLEDQALVARRVPGDDRRAVELTLTPAGDALVARHAGAMLAQSARETEGLTEDEATRLIGLLRKYTGLAAAA